MKRKNKEPIKNREEYAEYDEKYGEKKGDIPKMILIPIGILVAFILSWFYNSFQSGQGILHNDLFT